MSITLRPYQDDLVNGVRAAFGRGRNAPLAVAPTGAGKTVLFTYIADNAARNGHRSVIVCHRIELIKQTCRALADFEVPFGVIHPDYKPNYSLPIQVASIQTLSNRIEELVKNGFVPRFLIYDEAHHGTAGQWRKVREYWPAPRTLTLGVTATPIRTDGQGLGAQHQGGVYDELVMGPQIAELIELGYLVRPEVWAPEKAVDMAGAAIRAGEFDTREMEARVDRSSVTGDAVANYRKYADGLPAVAFCVSITHAEHVAAEFVAAGYAAYAVSGKTEKKLRARILKGLETGATQIVCSCDLISEGTDIPALGAAILLRPTASLCLYLQQVGRVLRPLKDAAGKPLKTVAVVLDHVGNSLRHGMPDEPREWSLDGIIKEKRKKKGDPVPPPRVLTCTECFNVHSPQPSCPRCGHVYPQPEPEPEPAPMEGNLVKITEEIQERIMNAKEREIAEARTLEDLQLLAQLRDYPAGWAKHTFKRREMLRSPKLAL